MRSFPSLSVCCSREPVEEYVQSPGFDSHQGFPAPSRNEVSQFASSDPGDFSFFHQDQDEKLFLLTLVLSRWRGIQFKPMDQVNKIIPIHGV